MRKHILLLLILCMALVNNAWCADEWLKTRPASGDSWVNWPADSQANNAAIDRLLANYRDMVMSYSSATTVSVSAGSVTCSNSDGSVRKMRQNTSATNVTFSDLDTGSESASTTYYVYADCDADATTATFKISTSSTAPTGATYYKRLGSIYNNSSSNITGVTNDNDSHKIGSPSSKSANVTYQAATDGWVVGYLSNSNMSSQPYFLAKSDNNSTPSTVVQYGSAPRDTFYTPSSLFTPISFPVRAGNYWKVTLGYHTGSSGGSVVINFISTGN